MRNSARRTVASILATAASVVALTGCTGDPDEIAACEELLERTALSVEGVDTAEFTCRRDFGNPGEGGTVTLAVDTQRKATPVIEEVYRAFAREPDIDSASIVYFDFTSKSGKEFNDESLGFNGDPYMDQIRDRYDIHPRDSD